jgi:hypothetical protein
MFCFIQYTGGKIKGEPSYGSTEFVDYVKYCLNDDACLPKGSTKIVIRKKVLINTKASDLFYINLFKEEV